MAQSNIGPASLAAPLGTGHRGENVAPSRAAWPEVDIRPDGDPLPLLEDGLVVDVVVVACAQPTKVGPISSCTARLSKGSQRSSSPGLTANRHMWCCLGT